MVKKRAWIKLLESFIAISLIVIILSVSIYGNNKKEDNSKNYIQEKEIETLNIIQENDTLRESILNVNYLPIESNESAFPEEIKEIWNKTISINIHCILRICEANEICESQNYPEKREIYVESVIISSVKEKYFPLQLKSFCYEK